MSRRRGAALRAMLLGATLAALALLRPPDRPAWRLCGFYQITGRDCPLCGMTRALCAAMKGEWMHALRLHALSPLVLGWLVGLFALSLAAAFGHEWSLPRRVRPVLWLATLGLFLGYWPLRLAGIFS